MRRATVICGLSTTLLLAGCGSSGPSDDPTESAEAFLAAMSDGDVATLCEIYAYRSEVYTGPVDDNHFTQSECETRMWDIYEDALNDPTYAEVTVGEAVVEGNKAEIPAENLDGWPRDNGYVRLQLFDGTWYVIQVDTK